MRVNHTTGAIVLRTRPYGESDKIVSFLTESHGKITGIAKGAKRSKKRFANSLDPCSLVILRFQESPNNGLCFLLSAELVTGSSHYLKDLESFSHASYLVEISDALIAEHEENYSLFQHLRNGLQQIDQYGASLRFLTWFELRLLSLAGYQPALENCKNCGKSCAHDEAAPWHFRLNDGSIFCQSCQGSSRDMLSLAASGIILLQQLQNDEVFTPATLLLPGPTVRDIRSALHLFLQYHAERQIKSVPFLYQFRTDLGGAQQNG